MHSFNAAEEANRNFFQTRTPLNEIEKLDSSVKF